MINTKHGSLAGTATPMPTASPVKDDGVKSEAPKPGPDTLQSPDDGVKMSNFHRDNSVWNSIPEIMYLKEEKTQKRKIQHETRNMVSYRR